jgi:hypothetical protein
MCAMVLDTVELRGDRGFIELQRPGQRRLEVANLRDVRQRSRTAESLGPCESANNSFR